MRSLFVIAASVGLLATGCWGESGETGTSTGGGAKALAQAVTRQGLRADLAALQRIADANGGTRASGTPGYDASVAYVVTQLRKAGFRPDLDRFRYTDSRELERPTLARTAPAPSAFDYGDEFVSFRYSGSGDVQSRVRPVDMRSETSGCESSDFGGFERGSIALMRRGGCFFAIKVDNAASAGAAAVLVFNDGSPGHEQPLEATLVHTAPVPALSLANNVGETLALQSAAGRVDVRVHTHTEARQVEAANVLADLRGSAAGPPLLLGAHLDSIQAGPGINDNGSGVVTLLELAKQAQRLSYEPRQPIRFAFWAAEEAGLVGSRHYAKSLGADPEMKVAAVVNLDMVGSPNGEAFVYEGDGTIEDALAENVREQGLDPLPLELEGRSDHAPFADAGIPVGGLYTGADEPGPDGKPHDACYHRACDTLGNVDFAMLERMADALALAVFSDLTDERK
jgi:Zn-dependent M28 family amino/carboxypeptidase